MNSTVYPTVQSTFHANALLAMVPIAGTLWVIVWIWLSMYESVVYSNNGKPAAKKLALLKSKFEAHVLVSNMFCCFAVVVAHLVLGAVLLLIPVGH